MKIKGLNTKEENTWCPGCPNFSILHAAKLAFTNLVNEKKIKQKNITIASGVGCHAKIFDYINTNAFYGLHGRVLPVCLGMKASNPELTIVGFGGDGDTYAEGISHFVHACRYNVDFTMIVHNNQVFALTTGQATPTSEKGFMGASTPAGSKESSLNPIALSLISGATFVARAYALDVDHLAELIEQAIIHKGFAFIDVLQPCLTYHNEIPYLQKRIYKIDKRHDYKDFKKAFEKAKQWDYSLDTKAKIPIGIFYKIKAPTFEEKYFRIKKPWYRVSRTINWSESIKKFQ